MNRTFRVFDLERRERLNMFAEGADIESLAFDLMREEMVTGETVCYSPRRIATNRQYFSTETLGNPLSVLLVLLRVERAGGVDKYAAWLECFPDIHEDRALSFCTHLDIPQAPFFACCRVLTEHTFAGTWCVHEHTIKQIRCAFAEVLGFVESDDGIAVAPFLDVLAEDKQALTDYFVADKQAFLAEMLADKSRFATRRST